VIHRYSLIPQPHPLPVTRKKRLTPRPYVASEWINSSSPYRYSPSTSTFHQPALASKLLGQLLSVNANALSSVTLPKSVQLEDGREVSQGTNLAEVAKMGRNEDVAVGVLDAVIGSLAQQSE
jgi:small subunit ribosomal protein S29